MPEHFHQMIHTGSEGDGEIFHCPTCQRTIKIKLDPFEKVVVYEGDTTVAHTGNFFASAFLDQTLPVPEETLMPFSDWVESRPDLFGEEHG